MGAYRLSEVGQLVRELSMTPIRHRLRQLAGAERLVGLIEPEREYPHSFAYFHITGFRPRHASEAMLPGDLLLSDLVTLIDELSATSPITAGSATDSLHTPDDLARRLRVSPRTLARWKLRGLVGQWYAASDGRKRYAITQAALTRFVARHPDLVRRAAQFQVMAATEKSLIVERARELLGEQNRSMHAISKVIAAETGRAMETVRLLLQRFDVDNPESALFNRPHAPLSESDAILAAHRGGATIDEIAERVGQSSESVETTVLQGRIATLMREPISYMYNAMYDTPGASEQILSDSNGPVEQPLRQRSSERIPAAIPAYLQSLYRVPLLTAEGERRLFHRYNFLRHQAEQVRRELRPGADAAAAVDRIDELLAKASDVKSDLVQANLRLVISIAKRHIHRGRGPELFELISDGNLALMRAVDKFDVSRGFKFSTYASWAIVRHFARAIPDELRWEHRHQTGRDELLAVTGGPEAESADAREPEDLRRVLAAGLDQLDGRERAIIERHFGLTAARTVAPLEEIGRELGISKERARQIKERALDKLRKQLAVVSETIH